MWNGEERLGWICNRCSQLRRGQHGCGGRGQRFLQRALALSEKKRGAIRGSHAGYALEPGIVRGNWWDEPGLEHFGKLKQRQHRAMVAERVNRPRLGSHPGTRKPRVPGPRFSEPFDKLRAGSGARAFMRIRWKCVSKSAARPTGASSIADAPRAIARDSAE